MKVDKKTLRQWRVAVVGALSDGQWHTTQEIEFLAGLSPRFTRYVAAESPGLLIGLLGYVYKLIEFATAEKVQHTYNSLLMLARNIRKHARRLARAVASLEKQGD